MRADTVPSSRTPDDGPDFADASASASAALHLIDSIQSHGILASLDAQGVVTHLSANADELLGAAAPVLGERLRPEHLGGDARWLASLNAAPNDVSAAACPGHRQVTLNGHHFDLLVHRDAGATLVEWERCESGAERQTLGPLLHRLVKRLRDQSTVHSLLAEAVNGVRTLTGLDRVMVYRFRRAELGGGGDVVAEARVPELAALLGSSFPEEGVPAEVKRLAQINSVRLIADAHSAPVPLLHLAGHDAPLDLTHAVLRSAGPVPIEYLRRSGLGATLTLPLVVDEQLWGIISCHHRTRLLVPYPSRSVCAVFAELVSAQLQSQLEKDRVARERLLERLRSGLLDQMHAASEPAQVLTSASCDIAEAFGAQAVLVSHQSTLHAHGTVTPELWSALRLWLVESAHDSGHAYATNGLARAAPHLSLLLDGWAGLLSICYDPSSQARILLLRHERPETVTWGAWPVSSERARSLHPDQPSQEKLHGFSQPWSAEDVAALDALGADLRRLVAVRVAEMHRYRTAVRAMLHGPANDGALPDATTPESRFERVLHQAMELSLLRQGVRPLTASQVDLERLLAQCISSAQQRHRGTSIYFDGPARRDEPPGLNVRGEPERLGRLLDGLLENAIRHGLAGESVVARVSRDGPSALVEISNISPPIDRLVMDRLFSATEPASSEDSRSGLGFGLYIGQTIAQAHGGSLAYAYEEPFVTMSVRLPAGPLA